MTAPVTLPPAEPRPEWALIPTRLDRPADEWCEAAQRLLDRAIEGLYRLPEEEKRR